MRPHVRRFLVALPLAIAASAVLWWLLGGELPRPDADRDRPADAAPGAEPALSPRLVGASPPADAGSVARGTPSSSPPPEPDDAPTLRLAGRVLQQDGVTPFTSGGVRVDCIPSGRPGSPDDVRRAPLDDDGRFELDGLPPGRVRVQVNSVYAVAGSSVSTVTDAGDMNVELVLGRRSALAIRLVDRLTGDALPAGEFHVFVDPAGDGPGGFVPAKGALGYETGIETTPGKRYRIRVIRLGWTQESPLVVEAPSTGGLLDVDVAVRRAPKDVAWLTIHLRPEGAAVPDVLSTIGYDGDLGVGSEMDLHERAGADLVYRLLPGRHFLRIWGGWDDAEPSSIGRALVADVDVTLEPGERREIQVPLRRCGRIFVAGARDMWGWTGTITRRDETIRLYGDPDEWKDESGVFFDLVPPGTWTLRVTEVGESRRGKVTVRAGAVTRVEFDALEHVDPK